MREDPLSRIRDIIGRQCRTRRQATCLDGLTLFQVDGPSPGVSTMYRPTLCIVAGGRKQVLLGERIYEYDRSQYMIVTVDVPVTGCVIEASPGDPYLGLTLDLDPVAIADLLLQLLQGRQPPGEPVALAVSKLGADLLGPLARLVGLLDRPADIPVLAPLIKREIYYRLLQGEQGALLRQVATAGSHLAQIGVAADWIRSNYARPMQVETLAEQAGMSVTSFHRHFKAVTMMSPLQYRTRVRLQEARRLMLVAGQDAGAIGFDVGYESPSQFSREYRRMFGVPPATDAARLRRQDAAPR